MTPRSMTWALWALLCTLPCLAFAQAEQDKLDEIQQRGSVEIAVYQDFPPWSYKTQAGNAGIDVDLAAALARELKLPLHLRMFVAGETMDDDLRNNVWKGHYLGGGVADVMLHVGMDPRTMAQQDHVSMFSPYFHEAVSVAFRPGRYTDLESPLRLAGSKVAVELDSISDYYMSGAFNGRLRTSAVRYPSATEAVAAFLRGEADAVMAPRGELQGLLHEAQAGAAEKVETHQAEFQGMFRASWEIGMAIKADNPKLQAALVSAMERIRASGELAEICKRYGVEYTAPEPIGSASGMH